MSMLRSELRRRGRATTQRALACHRGIAACTRYRAAAVRALAQILCKQLGANFFGGRGDAGAGATEISFCPCFFPFFTCRVVWSFHQKLKLSTVLLDDKLPSTIKTPVHMSPPRCFPPSSRVFEPDKLTNCDKPGPYLVILEACRLDILASKKRKQK
jgi:hypothetical protein